jgi:sulfate adenylyltransferase
MTCPRTPSFASDTEGLDVDTCAHQVLLKLEAMGLVKG